MMKLNSEHVIFLLAALLLAFGNVAGQGGDPFITNYYIDASKIDKHNWAILQDEEEVMLFANRKGICSFDGTHQWRFINTPDVPYSFCEDTAYMRIYVGCRNDFGYIKKDKKGTYHYHSISSGRKEFGDITRVALSGQYVYYYCSNAVFKVLREDCAVISTWNHKVSEPFTGFLLLHGAAFVNVIKLGLHRLTEKSYTPVKGGEILAGTQILFYFKYDSKHVLLGTSDNKLYLYDGKVFKDYKTNVDEYLQESVIAGGRNIGKNEFVLSTVTGGCIFISKKGQKSSHIVNYQTGLPDDEIYALGTDNKGGVWASHEYGISRIDNTLPIRNYSNYPGLEGNVISMIKYDSTIYVSTSEGVYYLSKAKSYKEIEVLVKVAEKRKPPSVQQAFQPQLQTVPEPEHTKDGQENKTKKKQNFFQKLFKKKKNKEQSKQISGDENKHPAPTREEEVPTAQTPHKPQGGQTSVSHRKKKIYAIQSVRHIYKKVQGLNEKCKQLIISNKHLLVATNTGVYDISDNHALAIVKNFYVNQIAHSKNKRRLFVGTAEGLLSLLFANNEWQVEQNFRDFHENAFTLIEDDRHHLWVGSENMVYDIVLDKTASPVYTKSYMLQSSSSEFILVRNVFGRPFFFLSNGVYSYDEKSDTIFYNEKINRDFQANSRFIYSQENITWVYNGKSWVSLNRIADITALDETYLELFDDIQNIYVDDVKNIWIIDGHNNLYKILPFSNRSAKQLFNVYIRQISDESGQLFSISNLELDYKHNSISFRISAPYYVKKEATEYQYIVEGLMKTWTKWSTDPNIELPFIPAGHYRFRVRARNVLGELSKEKSFDFRIIPPFWNSWWFYTLCGLLALSLFYGLLKFRESNLKRSKMLLEEKVKIRTEQLEKEKVKSEELLLNILPSETAEELKTKGRATAKHYNMVSVMFSDFKGFTNIAENIKAETLVHKLDECFVKFDEIIERYHLEKIKTIGDAYMCAGGIPVENQNNPLLIILAAIEIREFMNQLREQKKNEEYWELRLGIHTGPLIAGVVGKKKFAYDIWGDTVNTASRMESSSMPGKINISGATHNLVKKYFSCEYRGKIEAKNKGKIDMYFVENILPKYASDKSGIVPNDLFKEILKII